MTRAEGERERIRHVSERLRASLVNLDTALRLKGHLGADNSEAIQNSAAELARHIAAHDAYVWAEHDRALQPEGLGTEDKR